MNTQHNEGGEGGRAKFVPPRARKRNIVVPRNSPSAKRRSCLKSSCRRLFRPRGGKVTSYGTGSAATEDEDGEDMSRVVGIISVKSQ